MILVGIVPCSAIALILLCFKIDELLSDVFLGWKQTPVTVNRASYLTSGVFVSDLYTIGRC